MHSFDSFHGLNKKCKCAHGCEACSPMLTSDMEHPVSKREVPDAPSFDPAVLTPDYSHSQTPEATSNPFGYLQTPPKSPGADNQEALSNLLPQVATKGDTKTTKRKRIRTTRANHKKPKTKQILNDNWQSMAKDDPQRRVAQNRIAQRLFRKKARLAKEKAQQEATKKAEFETRAHAKKVDCSRNLTNFVSILFQTNW